MIEGFSNETSAFDDRSIDDVYREIRGAYERYPQPFVIGYSGGKDSTAVLQLVWKAIETLPLTERSKPVFVLAADTGVETPTIISLIEGTLHRINERAKATDMPFHAQKVVPTLSDSYWVNLIGRGYPAPTYASCKYWCAVRFQVSPHLLL